MKRTKRFLAAFLAFAVAFCYTPTIVFADAETAVAADVQEATFADMPKDWSTEALSNAVANGLLKGYPQTDGLHIKPRGTLSRAEMAAVVNRAFGAEETTDLNGVSDVGSGAWYAGDMAKAVHMGTMKLAATMRPNDKITRQEAFTILTRAFKMEAADGSSTALTSFKDKSSIATWAAPSISALVEKGVLSGTNGLIKPTDYITRAEFAKIMDNMVKQYINTAGTLTEVVAAGNVMVNVPDVTLKNLIVNGDLILGDGVGSGEITLDNVKVTGKTIVRGGGINSVSITGNSSIENLVIAKVDGNVRVAASEDSTVSQIVVNDGKKNVLVEGKVGALVVAVSDVPVVVQKASITTLSITIEAANLTVAKEASVTTINVAQAAEGAKVSVAGTVTTLVNAAPNSELAVTGTVKTVEVTSTAKGTSLEVAKDANVDKLATSVDMTTKGEGKVSAITGTGTVTTNGSATAPATTPVSSKSSGKSKGSSSNKLDVSNQVGAIDAAIAVILAKVDSVQTVEEDSTEVYTGPDVTKQIEVAASFDGGGDGSSGSPWEIDTAEELALMQEHLDGHFLLTGDIDLDGYNWVPIGKYVPKDPDAGDVSATLEVAFTGSFDGGGHTISNLTINRDDLEQRDMSGTGLFGGTADDFSIYDLNLEDVEIFSSGSCTGALVGMSMSAEDNEEAIQNINLSGNNKIAGSFYVAGLLGSAQDTNMEDCAVEADVTLTSAGGSGAGLLGGGLEGGNLSNCIVTGTVTATEAMNYKGTTMGVSGIGGLAGCAFESEEVINCRAEDVTIKVGANAIMIGGLLGYAGIVNEGVLAADGNGEGFTLIKECEVTGLEIQAGAGANRIGGIVGSGFCGPNYNSFYPASSAMHLVDCQATGTIQADSDVIVGSILGYAFRNCIVVSCDGSGITGAGNQVGAGDAAKAVILAEVDAVQTLESESAGTYTGPTVTAVLAAADAFAEGDGSKENPWQIATKEQLARVHNYLDKHFVLIDNIDLTGYNWIPIGAYVPRDPDNGDVSAIPEEAFTGSFDGGGYTISNLTINREEVGQRDMSGTGLFGGLAGEASIQNLKIKNATIFSTGSCTGALVGMSMPSAESGITIKDISISGKNKVAGSFYAAGLVGSAQNTNMKNCTVEADVLLTSAGGSGAGILGGGLEGGSLSNCTVTGTVTATEAMHDEGITMGVSGIGGLAGCAFESDKVINCKAENVTIKVGANAIMIGGLLGYAGIVNEGAAAADGNAENFTLIKDCEVTGLTLQAGAGANRIGGIVGSGFCGPNYNKYYPASSAMHLVNCQASGTIQADSDVIVGSILGYGFRNCAVVSCDGSGITGVRN
ncbi:S-layer homology domain-containing protein [Aminipila butyrica]|uniref:S-layer homology domain-containing protein n=1 Tax=Aminipila butyrica TaxID=433296 RepID=A0A858BYX1_9FIRM|nr:S-layer homology domain-containing protein [Aminipila butyrica]QIB70419.1 S-layer homology domain-containing protein [Aminipila butyrica]